MNHKKILIFLSSVLILAVIILFVLGKKNDNKEKAKTEPQPQPQPQPTSGSLPVAIEPKPQPLSNDAQFVSDMNRLLNSKFTTPKDVISFVSYPVQKGSKGNNVKMLQYLLGVKVDGDFGTNTEYALKNALGVTVCYHGTMNQLFKMRGINVTYGTNKDVVTTKLGFFNISALPSIKF